MPVFSETHNLGPKVQNSAVQVSSNKTAHICDVKRMLLMTITKSFQPGHNLKISSVGWCWPVCLKFFLLVSLHKSQMKMEEEVKTTVTVSANCETFNTGFLNRIVHSKNTGKIPVEL